MPKPPKFWQEKEGKEPFYAHALQPLSRIYEWGGRRRFAKTVPYRAGLPVICVGNITLGGVGKTPFTSYLTELLKHEGMSPAVLMRGYGGREKGPLAVTRDHAARDVGDEALLQQAQGNTVYVARDREEGARHITAQGDANVIVMDDGFQNPALVKDLSFVLVDAETVFGNGKVFPAGPLREPVAEGSRRADAVVLVKPEQAFETPQALTDQIREFAPELPQFSAWLEPVLPPAPGPVVAFSGIGRPDKFFRMARACGFTLTQEIEYPDHHKFSARDMRRLMALSHQYNAPLLTTEKDHMRLSGEMKRKIKTLPVRMRVDDEAGLRDLVLGKLKRAQ